MIVSGISMVRQCGRQLVMSEISYAKQLRRIVARDKRNIAKKLVAQ